MWMWVVLLAFLSVIGVIGPLWTLLAVLFTWFVLIPALSLWIAVHLLIEEEEGGGA